MSYRARPTIKGQNIVKILNAQVFGEIHSSYYIVRVAILANCDRLTVSPTLNRGGKGVRKIQAGGGIAI